MKNMILRVGLIFHLSHVMKSFKIFFEKTHLISTEVHMNVPLLDLYQIFARNFDPPKSMGFMGWAYF